MKIQLSGCIIRDEKNNILLLHRNTKRLTQWELPGGKVEAGESAEQAAVREVREELGVKVKINKYLGSASFIHNAIDYDYAWFDAKIVSGKPAVIECEKFDDLHFFSTANLRQNKVAISINVQNFLARIKS